jgi:ATP/maltotriose-dependent transcriptional regulator MalT
MTKEYNIEHLSRKKTSSVKHDKIKDFIKKSITPESISEISNSFFAIIDMSNLGFSYISPSVKNILGFTDKEISKAGLKKIFELYHPEITLTQMAIHKRINEFLKTIAISKHPQYLFSFDVQLKNKSGNYIKLLQHNRIIKSDNAGTPLLIQIVCHDITHFKTEQRHILTLRKIQKNGYKTIFADEFFPEYENGILTKKETEIWKYINRGLSGKKIGELLNISIHTVNTHRKKIYKKLKAN